MADVTITSVVGQPQYDTIFESVDADARVITQDGDVIFGAGSRLLLEEGWVLACDGFRMPNTLPGTVPADPAADASYNFIMRNAELRVNNGGADDRNQIAGGRVRIENGRLLDMQTGAGGRYTFGAFGSGNLAYFNIRGLTVRAFSQRLHLHFVRAVSGSVLENLVFEDGNTDLNLNSGAHIGSISVNPRDDAADVGIATQDVSAHRDGSNNFNLYTYLDGWIFDNLSGATINAFVISPRGGNRVVLINPVIRNNRGVNFTPGLQAGAISNGAETRMEFRYRYRPRVRAGSANIQGAKVRISHANADFATFRETGRVLGTGATAGDTDKYIGDYTAVADHIFTTAANGQFAENALIRTRYRAATVAAHTGGLMSVFSGNFTRDIRHYQHHEVSGTYDFETQLVDPIENMAEDETVTNTDKAAVLAYATIANCDQLYDRIKAERSDYDTETPLPTNVGGVLTAGYSIVLHPGAADVLSWNAATNTLTVKSADTFAAGMTLESMRITGTGNTVSVQAGEEVEITAPYRDSSGVRATISGLPATSSAVAIAWPQSQGRNNRANAITGAVADDVTTEITLTLAADTAYFVVADAVGYRRGAVQSLDTTSQSGVEVALERIVDAQGNALIPSSLTTAETAQAGLVEWGASYIDVDADGTNTLTYRALVYAVERGQSTAAACGSLLHPARIEIGRITFPAQSSQKWRAKSALTDTDDTPNIEVLTVGKDGASVAEDYIDFTDPIIYRTEPPVSVTVDPMAPTVSQIVAAMQAGGASLSMILELVKIIRSTVEDLPRDVLDGIKELAKVTYGTGNIIWNPMLPSPAVQSATVQNGILSLIFRDTAANAAEDVNIESLNIPYVLAAGERLRLEMDVAAVNATGGSTRTEVRPRIAVELRKVVDTVASNIGTRRFHEQKDPVLEIGGRPKTLSYDFGYVPSDTVNQVILFVHVDSSDTDRVRLEIKDMRLVTDAKLTLDDFKADISSLATATALNAVAADATIARKILDGRYQITATHLIIYDDDGTTVYRQYPHVANTNPPNVYGGRGQSTV